MMNASAAPLQLYLVRHAETAWSLTGQHTGRTDLPLTAHGAAMARRLATTFDGIGFSHVFTSPRLRARDTCALAGLGGPSGARVEIEPDLAEWDYGEYEGLRTAEIHLQHPRWDVWEHGCPGGETPADAANRADRLIRRLCTLPGKVALFSHGQFGRVLAARWVDLDARQGQHLAIDPASLSILSSERAPPHRRVIALWNATAFWGKDVA